VTPPAPAAPGASRPRILWGLGAVLAVLAIAQLWSLWRFQPPGIDFLPLWTAGRFAWTMPDRIYDFAAVTHAQAWLLGELPWQRPYAYPPTALLLLVPLGAAPFWVALAIWLGLGFGLWVWAGLRLAPQRTRLAALLIIASPAAGLAAYAGQSVLLVAGLATLAVTQLSARPRLAGVLLATAAMIKPQALVLAPFALLAAGAFEALASAAVTAGLLLLASVGLFGVARWTEWLGSLQPFQRVVEGVPALMTGVITPYGLARQLGLEGAAAIAWRVVFALFAAALVWRAFARSTDPALRLAALLGGGLLVVPYAMHYDGALLVPAAVALASQRLGEPRWLLRLLALLAACEVTAPHIGAIAVVAFLLLANADLIVRPAPAAQTVAS